MKRKTNRCSFFTFHYEPPLGNLSFCWHLRFDKSALTTHDSPGRKISTAKTEVLHLSRNPDQCVLQVNGATLKQVEKFKYLGVTFTSDGRQDEELDTRIGKASAVMRA